MLKCRIISLCLFGFIYSECSDMNYFDCGLNINCEWVEDFSYGSCGSLTVSQCYDYPGQCYVDSNPGWYDSSGPYCTGGTYQINNSYCQEIEMLECSEMDMLQCDSGDGCHWLADIESGNCTDLLFEDDCISAACNWEYGCIEMGWWYNWCYTYGYECTGGTYQIDNGYCEEVEMPECSEMNQSECSSNGSCDWIENIDVGSCSSLSLSDCDLPEYGSCYSDCTNWGSYYNGMFCYGTMYCAGGNYQTDNSYCEENSAPEYQLGDINNDYIVNIQDVIIIVNLALNLEYSYIADVNSDNRVDILDIIELVNIIMN